MENSKLLGCAIYDKIRGNYVAFTFCNSKAEYIRSNVESAIMSYKNLNDLQPEVLCQYNVVTGEFDTTVREKFSFSEYKMPATKAEALAPLGVDFAKEALEFEEWKKSRNKE